MSLNLNHLNKNKSLFINKLINDKALGNSPKSKS